MDVDVPVADVCLGPFKLLHPTGLRANRERERRRDSRKLLDASPATRPQQQEEEREAAQARQAAGQIDWVGRCVGQSRVDKGGGQRSQIQATGSTRQLGQQNLQRPHTSTAKFCQKQPLLPCSMAATMNPVGASDAQSASQSTKRPYARNLSGAEVFAHPSASSSSNARDFERVDSRGEYQLAAAPPLHVLAGLQSVGMKARMGQ